ncbi:MAG: hypothetical protein KGM60_13420 [Comamonadaceae bacterium]|nr:hypothetical protein [Comamonadaceae bacterium]
MNPHAPVARPSRMPLPPLVATHDSNPASAAAHPGASGAKVEERLPFSVRVVSDAAALDKAVHIRQAAYARHVPDLARTLGQPEPADFADGSLVLLAESNLDGSPVGTMRIQTNRYAPLALEQSVALPPSLSHCVLAEATRLGVTDDRVGTLVKTVLFKALYLYCLHSGVDWMVVTGRAPVDRQYMRLLFDDVYPELGYIPMRHVGNLPHRVMKFEVGTAERRWAEVRHPLFNFMVLTHHPDIRLDAPVVSEAPVQPQAPFHAPAPTLAM